MERHGNHRPHLAQVHPDASIVVCNVSRIQFGIILTSAMNLIKFLNCIVRPPDGGQTGRLCRHDIDADPKISGK